MDQIYEFIMLVWNNHLILIYFTILCINKQLKENSLELHPWNYRLLIYILFFLRDSYSYSHNITHVHIISFNDTCTSACGLKHSVGCKIDLMFIHYYNCLFSNMP